MAEMFCENERIDYLRGLKGDVPNVIGMGQTKPLSVLGTLPDPLSPNEKLLMKDMIDE